MSEPLAVLASFVRLSTLADGTVRAIIDIEPKNRTAAFALFDEPGAPLAVARITNEAAVAHDRGDPVEAPTDPLPPHKLPAALSTKVALTCRDRSFADFLGALDPDGFGAVRASGCEEPVAQYVRDLCGVASRSEIKPGSPAARQWESLKATYEHWQRTGEAA